MKRTVIALTLFMALFLAVTVYAHAEEEKTVSVSSLSVISYPTKTVYGAFEQLDTGGLSLRATFSDGTEKVIGGQEVRVSYSRDNCLRVGDDSVTVTYGSKSISLPVTVNRISYDLSAIELSDFSVTYNGSFRSYSKAIPQIVGLDGIPLNVSASGGGVNVGVYDITVDFTSDSGDYIIPESRVIRMTIAPAAAEMIWEGVSFVYDGKSKSPVAYYIDVNGARVYPTVSGGAINAGTGYIATAATNDANYIFSNTSVSFDINKADYDLSGVVWSKDSFTYDGSKKSITASGLPVGVSIIGYKGDMATDAGKYTVSAILSWDEKNYNQPADLTHSWEICKADYDMSGVSFRNESYTYDGKMHYPTLVGSMPRGADGILLEYSFSAGACHVSDGTVSVTVSFYTSSGNYNVPAELYSSISIIPCSTYVIWGELSLFYNGGEQLPTAYSPDCVITLSGGATNVGKYVATATTENTDYYIANDKAEYTIVKAQNYWVDMPSESVCYEGKDITLVGKSRFGDVKYSFYADAECKQEISSPTALGRYYAVIYVNETDNYYGIKSEPIAFEIVEIVPVSFLAGILKGDIRAFDTLTSEDIICSVLNNDGSICSVDSTLVTVIYESADSFRRADTTVRLKYGDFVLTLAVEVNYADYDLSGVSWCDTVQTYDGTRKMPSLCGLPAGVSVVEYTGGQNINAGKYTVSAVFSYDTENYNAPVVTPCDFVIEKCSVSIPLFTSVYNGDKQLPTSDSPLYTVIDGGGYTDAGIYSVLVSLTDSSNYSFSGGAESVAHAVFRIMPAKIKVSISEVKLRLFEKLREVHVRYTIVDGVIYGEDILKVSPYREGKQVFLKSENPNYTLDVTSGRLIRLPYPTVEGAIVLLIALMLLFLASFAGVRIYRNRDKIATAAAMARCRWHNRGYKAPMPRGMDEPPVKSDAVAVSTERDEESDEITHEIPTEDGAEGEVSEIPLDESTLETVEFEIDAEKADTLITDSLAKSLIRRDGEIIYTDGGEKAIINLGDISANFNSGDRVDVNSLKQKGLLPEDAAYVKVLGGGKIDKQFNIYANDFSLSAVKMIALTGGQAIKIVTFKRRSRHEKD